MKATTTNFWLIVYVVLCNEVEDVGPIEDKNMTAINKKQWCKYTEALITGIIGGMMDHHITCMEEMLKFVLQTLVSTSTQKNIHDYYTLHNTFVKFLSFTIKTDLHQTHIHTHFLKTTETSFFFMLDKHLRSKMHFVELRIFGLHYLCQYWFQVIHLHTNPQFNFTLCGIHSYTDIYPPSPDVRMYLLTGVHHNNSLCLFVVFDIIGTKVIETDTFQMEKPFKPQMIILTHDLEQIIKTFHFVLSKLTQVQICLNSSARKAVLFDGPGFLSEWTVFTRQFLCSSFQCIVQIHQQHTESDEYDLSFSPKIPTEKQCKQLNLGKRGLAMYSKMYTLRQSISYLVIFSAATQHINISIVQWNFWGREHQQCLHGGISLFEGRRSYHTEKETICSNRHKAALYLKNIYMKTNEFTLVTYTYEKYGSLDYTLKLSSVVCNIVKINLCKKMHEIFEARQKNIVLKQMLETPRLISISSVANALDSMQKIEIKKRLNCSIVQVFVNLGHHCSIVPSLNIEAGILIFRSYVKITYSHNSNQMLTYKISGVLADKSAFHTQALLSMESSLTVAGRDIYHNKQDDIEIIELNETHAKKISNELKNYMLYNKSQFPPRLVSERELDSYMRFLPTAKTDWIFCGTMHTRTPTHKDSPLFYVSFLGDASWVEIHLSLFDNRNKSLLTMDLNTVPMPLLKLPRQEAVMFEISKSDLAGINIELQINASSKVN